MDGCYGYYYYNTSGYVVLYVCSVTQGSAKRSCTPGVCCCHSYIDNGTNLSNLNCPGLLLDLVYSVGVDKTSASYK